MIFNENLDRTLWLILVSDKKNREQIAGLISSLPMEIVLRIREEFKDRDSNGTLKKVEFSKAMRDSLGNTYLYRVKINKGKLNISLSRWKQSNSDLEEVYELDLVPISRDIDLKSLLLDDTLDDSVYIGGYSWRKSRLSLILWNTGICEIDSVEYELYENLCGNLVIQLLSDDIRDKVIDIDKMPDEIDMENLGSKSNINRLVRGRRRK